MVKIDNQDNEIKLNEENNVNELNKDNILSFPTMIRNAGYSLALIATQINALVDIIIHPELSYLDADHIIIGGTSGAIIAISTFLFSNHVHKHEKKRKVTQIAINNLLKATSTLVGSDYLIELSRQVSKIFNTNYTFITKYCQSGNFRTIALLKDDELQENYEYELKNTPCEFVKEKGPQFFSENVQMSFPKDVWLQNAGIESYFAVPLFDLSGNISGHMGVMDSKPLVYNNILFSFFEILAKNAGIEIDRMNSELALRESEDQFRTLFEHAGDAIFVIDPSNNCIVETNKQAAKITGYSLNELAGMNLQEIHPEEMKVIENLFEAVLENGSAHRNQFSCAKKNGDIIPIELSCARLKIKDKVFILSSVRDISERQLAEKKRAEALLMTEKAARLTSLGTMAAGISHEINQPLTALKIRVDGMLMRDMSKKNIEIDDIRKNLQFVTEQADRIDDIIKQMRVLASNKQAAKGEIVDINTVVKNSLSLIKQKISSKGITVDLRLAKDLPVFDGRLTSMQQVVINLAFNAIDAMDSVENNNKMITFSTKFNNKECMLMVRDSGPGISNEDIDQIFDPFYSNKTKGDGMGIGLSVTQQIVNSLGGNIKAKNNKEGGACFTVSIPV